MFAGGRIYKRGLCTFACVSLCECVSALCVCVCVCVLCVPVSSRGWWCLWAPAIHEATTKAKFKKILV